jgi:ABC-type nitrate/sulfonate/bicarbonate transport system substrate-binding protein
LTQVEVVPRFFPSGAECLLEFYAGRLEFAFLGHVPFTLARASAVPVSLLAVANVSRGGEAVVEVGSAAPRNGPLRLGTPFNTTAHLLAHRAEAQGWTGAECAFHYMNPELLVSALRQGYIDAVSLWEPYQSLIMEELGGVVRAHDGLDGEHALNLLVVSQRALRSAPEVVQRFNDANASMTRWIAEHPQEANTALCSLLSSPDVTPHRFDSDLLGRYEWTWRDEGAAIREVGLEERMDRSARLLRQHDLPYRWDQGRGTLLAEDQTAGHRRQRQSLSMVRVGYSADVMCAAPLLLGAQRRWGEWGFSVKPHRKLASERLVRYDAEAQAILRQVFVANRHASTDLVSLRALVERSLRRLADRIGLIDPGDRPRGLFQYLRLLQEAGAIPSSVKDYSHLIRLLGNDAAHGNRAHTPDMPLLRELAMRILDWAYAETPTNCRGCGKALGPAWQFCSYCGTAVEAAAGSHPRSGAL